MYLHGLYILGINPYYQKRTNMSSSIISNTSNEDSLTIDDPSSLDLLSDNDLDDLSTSSAVRDSDQCAALQDPTN